MNQSRSAARHISHHSSMHAQRVAGQVGDGQVFDGDKLYRLPRGTGLDSPVSGDLLSTRHRLLAA